MRKVVALLVVALLVLGVVPAATAEPPAGSGRDNIKVKIFVHYPRPDRDSGRPIAKPQCQECVPTTNDKINDYGVGEHLPAGTTIYRVNYATIPSTVGTSQAVIARSFQTWQAAQGRVKLVEGATTTATRARLDGINLVAWGRVSASNAIAITYYWYNPSSGEIVEADTIMNSALPWASTQISDPDHTCSQNLCAYDAQDILTHEIGHWMGLNDLYNSADQDLTMYGYGMMGELKKDTLGLGDLTGVQSIH